MPPKAKINREMILNAAFEILCCEGIESVSVRAISDKLNCSTQPVMYNFPSVESIKKALYQKSDDFHIQYVMDLAGHDDPIKEICLAYVRFAAEETNLFKFLFQTDGFCNHFLNDIINDEAMLPVFKKIAESQGESVSEAKEQFLIKLLTVHGLASLLANNSMEYDFQYISKLINEIFKG